MVPDSQRTGSQGGQLTGKNSYLETENFIREQLALIERNNEAISTLQQLIHNCLTNDKSLQFCIVDRMEDKESALLELQSILEVPEDLIFVESVQGFSEYWNDKGLWKGGRKPLVYICSEDADSEDENILEKAGLKKNRNCFNIRKLAEAMSLIDHR